MASMLACVRSGRVFRRGEKPFGDDIDGSLMLMAVEDAEPYYEQCTRSARIPMERTDDGRFDRSALVPERAYRIGRDYFAHCIRYGWPMRIIREHFAPVDNGDMGPRIFEAGCGTELPMFRTLTMDLSAVRYYKPSTYVGVDLGTVRYRPKINGIDVTIKERANFVTDRDLIPIDQVFDLVVSFEVLEHMDKPDGEAFLDALVGIARRKVDMEGGYSIIALSTPVNGGMIAKNHIYEWRRSELKRALERRGCEISREFGTFANLRDVAEALTDAELEVWNSWANYHSPHTLACMFATAHPEAARNIAWEVIVR